jgi:hypothetical protein
MIRTTSVMVYLLSLSFAAAAQPWRMHTIDDSSRGADGVRLGDMNNDGLPDIITGWEEGGVVRVYFHPGYARAGERWPQVTVGAAPSVEDATWFDFDSDGHPDVVSCCEGSERTMYVHIAPNENAKLLDPEAWTTRPLPASVGLMQWMFCVPMQMDGRNGVDLVAGGKGDGAQVGWFESPEDPRDLSAWRWHPLAPVGWLMSLVPLDIEGDGDMDILFTDRYGPQRGYRVLVNPGEGAEWTDVALGAEGEHVMFMAAGRDGVIYIAAKPRNILRFNRADGRRFDDIALPSGTGTSKAVAVGDVDRDGKMDVVFTCEGARNVRGVMYLSDVNGARVPHDISGKVGTKYDLVELLDLDDDGDLDVLTCEEREGLGVIWYENPADDASHGEAP